MATATRVQKHPYIRAFQVLADSSLRASQHQGALRPPARCPTLPPVNDTPLPRQQAPGHAVKERLRADILAAFVVGGGVMPLVALLCAALMQSLGPIWTLVIALVLCLPAGWLAWRWHDSAAWRWRQRLLATGVVSASLLWSLLCLVGWRALVAPEFFLEAPHSFETLIGDAPESATFRPSDPTISPRPLSLSVEGVTTLPEYSATAEVELLGLLLAQYRLVPVTAVDDALNPTQPVRVWLACPTSSSIKCLETSTHAFQGAVSVELASDPRWRSAVEVASAHAKRDKKTLAADPRGLVLYPMKAPLNWWRKLSLIALGIFALVWVTWFCANLWWWWHSRPRPLD